MATASRQGGDPTRKIGLLPLAGHSTQSSGGLAVRQRRRRGDQDRVGDHDRLLAWDRSDLARWLVLGSLCPLFTALFDELRTHGIFFGKCAVEREQKLPGCPPTGQPNLNETGHLTTKCRFRSKGPCEPASLSGMPPRPRSWRWGRTASGPAGMGHDCHTATGKREKMFPAPCKG